MEKKKYLISIIFLFVAGALDAYTLLCCGGVFTAMQTGNLIYIFINLATLNFAKIPKYIFSLLLFLSGIMAQHFISRLKNGKKICYVLIPSLYIVGFLVSVLSNNYIVSNAVFSFGMAIQLQMTRAVDSFAIANTMCTGNMRSLMECLSQYITTKDKKYLRGVSIYSTLIASFVIGVASVAAIIKFCFGGI